MFNLNNYNAINFKPSLTFKIDGVCNKKNSNGVIGDFESEPMLKSYH